MASKASVRCALPCHVAIARAICPDHCSALVLVLPPFDIHITVLNRAQRIVRALTAQTVAPGDVDWARGSSVRDPVRHPFQTEANAEAATINPGRDLSICVNPKEIVLAVSVQILEGPTR